MPPSPPPRPATLPLVWRFETGAEVWSSPAIGPDSRVYFGATDGKVYAVDGRTGKLLWTFPTFASVCPSMGGGACRWPMQRRSLALSRTSQRPARGL